MNRDDIRFSRKRFKDRYSHSSCEHYDVLPELFGQTGQSKQCRPKSGSQSGASDQTPYFIQVFCHFQQSFS